jgi:hypothetical protein
MADQMTSHAERRTRHTGRNGSLLLALVLCIEFWAIVSSYVAHSL